MPEVASGSAGAREAAPAGDNPQLAAETPRRRTGARRCRTAGAVAVVAPTAGTRRRRTSPPHGSCRRRRASRRPWLAGAVMGLGNWGRTRTRRRGGK
jgi:hypothetical protein